MADAAGIPTERLRELAEQFERSARSRRGFGMTDRAIDDMAHAAVACRAVIAVRELCEEWGDDPIASEFRALVGGGAGGGR